jgi:hypothetical protein
MLVQESDVGGAAGWNQNVPFQPSQKEDNFTTEKVLAACNDGKGASECGLQ